MEHILFIPSSADRLWVWFHFLASMNNTAVIIHNASMCGHVFTAFKFLGVELWGFYEIVFNFLKKLPKLFSKAAVLFYIPTK